MPLDRISLLVNGGLLAIMLVVLGIILNLGSRYNYNYGIAPIQTKLKWRILRLLFFVIALAFIAVIFNIAYPLLAPS